jgi:hypothetical protein
MTKLVKLTLVAALVVAILFSLPLILKGAVITVATVMVALVLAGMFLLGLSVALAITSPLWIPFLAGWAAVKYCRRIKDL